VFLELEQTMEDNRHVQPSQLRLHRSIANFVNCSTYAHLRSRVEQESVASSTSGMFKSLLGQPDRDLTLQIDRRRYPLPWLREFRHHPCLQHLRTSTHVACLRSYRVGIQHLASSCQVV
jgi:hypothetical protein